ncbi:MAG TPA: transglutaminase-like domain-containing protein, partial [Gemmataceae bacterium]|nr:transglutaminase-like domain-containing protein [Gemmataceae bacterium]
PPDPPGVIIIRPKGQPDPNPGAQPVQAQPIPALAKADGAVLFDYWFAAAVDGQMIGYTHWHAAEVERNGRKFRTGTRSQKFTVSRFGQVVTQTAEESTTETADGEVLVTSFSQSLGTVKLAISGVVDGKVLKVKGDGLAEGAKDTPWPGGVVGIAREPLLFKEKKLKPGESFDYLSYVPPVNRVVKITVTHEGEEALALWPNTPPRKLHKYVARMEPLGDFKFPPSTTWCDPDSGEPLLVEFKYPPLGGRVAFLRTTEQAATAPIARPLELFNAQAIRLDREIPGIHTRGSVVYKVTMADDENPPTAFVTDARQQVKNYDPKTKSFELHVSAAHGPVMGAKPEPAPGKEYLGSSFFINWDNDPVKGHAAKAVAGLPANASAWDKARAVEQWVNQNMKAFEFSQAMAPADEVARTLSGDCTEYAMLSAAMCRALGVPSRTVIGLVHAPGKDGRFYLAYHMWTEVYADGQWVPIDATLGTGGIGPGHVKIADQSWHEERSIAPLLPMLRVLMAKPTVEVLKVGP